MIFTLFTRAVALRFMAAGAPFAARRIRILPLNQHVLRPKIFGMKGSSHLSSQITGGVENAVPLYIDILRTGGRGFDLPSEDSLQEYLKFPYENFLSDLHPFEGYCCKLCPSNNPRRKNQKIYDQVNVLAKYHW
jgi:hypothetical protein